MDDVLWDLFPLQAPLLEMNSLAHMSFFDLALDVLEPFLSPECWAWSSVISTRLERLKIIAKQSQTTDLSYDKVLGGAIVT